MSKRHAIRHTKEPPMSPEASKRDFGRTHARPFTLTLFSDERAVRAFRRLDSFRSCIDRATRLPRKEDRTSRRSCARSSCAAAFRATSGEVTCSTEVAQAARQPCVCIRPESNARAVEARGFVRSHSRPREGTRGTLQGLAEHSMRTNTLPTMTSSAEAFG